MQARNSIFACLVTLGCIACNPRSNKSEAEKETASDSSIRTASPLEDTISVLTREDAETLVAKHYSVLNRQAKYPLYQGLLVAVDSISGAPGDTLKIHSTIHGRKWLTPNGDTTTLPFREIRVLNAWKKERQWNSD
jgi:hypothetical protein